MDCHHPDFVRGSRIHIAPDLAAAAAHQRQKLGQRDPATIAKALCQRQKVIKRLINSTAKPCAEGLSAFAQHGTEK